MNSRLRIYVREDWPRRTRTPWVLLAPDGSLLQEGESDPTHWPASNQCEAVLSGAQTVWLHTHLPEKLPRGEFTRLLANALEEKMLSEPDLHHLTVTSRRDGEVGVLAIARERLRQIVAQLDALGRPLSRACSELQTAPAADDGWHLAVGVGIAILRRGPHEGIALDMAHDGNPPSLFAALVANLRTSGESIPTLTIHAQDNGGLAGMDAWQAGLDIEIRKGNPYRWYDVDATPVNLLHGEFSPRHLHNVWLKAIKPALWLATAAVAADLLVSAIQIGWQRYQIAVTEQRVAQMFRSAFPNVPAIDPPAQMTRQLDALRSPLGLLRSDDALALLACLADSAGANGRDAVQELRFENGALQVTLASSAAAQVDSLRSQLAIHGCKAIRSDGGGLVRLTLRRELNP